MNNYSVVQKLLLMLLFTSIHLHVIGSDYLSETFSDDTIKSNEIKKREKLEEKIQLRNSHQRFAIKFGAVYAFLDTKVSFDLSRGNLSSNLSLEDDLGLPSNSYFFAGSFLYRITPRSGIYAQYYGINRLENSQTEKDYIFKNVTIPAGTNIQSYFNTQVLSAGYMYSVLRDPNAFLGFYLNVYFMVLATGVDSDFGDINSEIKLAAPLPNLGIIASFRLANWLNLNGGVGFFALNTSDFGGSLYNVDISLMAKPAHWLGISLSYQQFDVRVYFPSDDINTVVDYNFKGPSLGLSFIF